MFNTCFTRSYFNVSFHIEDLGFKEFSALLKSAWYPEWTWRRIYSEIEYAASVINDIHEVDFDCKLTLKSIKDWFGYMEDVCEFIKQESLFGIFKSDTALRTLHDIMEVYYLERGINTNFMYKHDIYDTFMSDPDSRWEELILDLMSSFCMISRIDDNKYLVNRKRLPLYDGTFEDVFWIDERKEEDKLPDLEPF